MIILFDAVDQYLPHAVQQKCSQIDNKAANQDTCVNLGTGQEDVRCEEVDNIIEPQNDWSCF